MMFLQTFARSYHTFNAISENLDYLDKGTEHLVPFRSICNALLADAAISWCKVFGMNTEQTHWKSAVEDDENFREVLFSELATSQDNFRKYWKEMTDFRNNVVAHFNTEYFDNGMTPQFDMAMRSAASAHRYLLKRIPAGINYAGPICLDSYGKEVASAVLRRLRV